LRLKLKASRCAVHVPQSLSHARAQRANELTGKDLRLRREINFIDKILPVVADSYDVMQISDL
jgi:hypothetical protein